MAPSIFSRMFGSSNGKALVPIEREPKRLLTAEVKDGPVSLQTKASAGLLPKGAYGINYAFFSPDGGRTMYELDTTSLAFVAYWAVATRWRAQKISEAPLMVVAEDQENGIEEWLPDHPLVPLFDMPSPDYDMGELLEITSYFMDNTGAALWVLNRNGLQEPAIITVFSRNEFEPVREGNSLYAYFRVQTADGPKEFDAADVCFFKDMNAQSGRDWYATKSRLSIAMSWLRLSAQAQNSIYDLLKNSVWPSLVVTPDKDWDPDPATFQEYLQEMEKYAKHKGRPFVSLGGGSVNQLQAAIKDLVPNDILNRVESVVAAVSGVPAIVLQFQVGMENSPWSQMAQARRMAYDDCIIPQWRKMERVMTRQILRPEDEDTTHFVRFDSSNVEALQLDQLEAAQTATAMGKAASLNERRKVMGLEPSNDPKADEIPELTQPSLADILAAGGGLNAGDAANGKDPKAPEDQTEDPPPAGKKTWRERFARQLKAIALQDHFREEAIATWTLRSRQLLKGDADNIAELVEALLVESTNKSRESKARGKERVMAAVERYLKGPSTSSWTRAMQPLFLKGAERSSAVVSADLGINFNLMHPTIIRFAQKQTGKMISNVSKTTQSLVSDIMQGGLDANKSNHEIAVLIRDATGFDIARAELIARTEATKAFNGAPEEALAEYGNATGVVYTKTWSGVLDDRERDEHVEMEGETVNVGDAFSNGLDFPSEPNCRCTLLFAEADE